MNNRNATDWFHRIGIPLGLLILAIQGIRTISHADFWTHLSIGRWIAQHGIPRVDPLTLVSEGTAWVHANWLYDILLYRVWQIGGAGLITVLHVTALIIAFLLLTRVVRPYASPLAIGLALLISAWLLSPRFEVRPSTLCLIFPALYLFCLATPRQAWVPFAVLLPAQILWANLDASFIWGPILVLLYAAQAYFQPDRQPGVYVRLGALTAALLLVSMITPYGPAIFSAVSATWTAPLIRDWISPLSPHFVSNFSRHMVTLALILGALGLLTRKDRLPIALTGMAVISAFLVVHSMVAHVALFALFAFPFFCLSLQSVGEFVRDHLSPSLSRHIPTTQRTLGGVMIVLALISAFTLITNRHYVSTGNLSGFGLGVTTATYPDAAQAVIERADFPERFLNLPLDGGYLAWRNPDRRVFIDQRSELHAHDAYNTLVQGLLGHTQAWHSVLSEWDPEAIILNNAWPHASDMIRTLHANQAWETVYFDGTTTILVLGTSNHKGLLNEKEALLTSGLQHVEQARIQYRQELGQLIKPPIPAPLIGAAAIFQGRGFYRQAAACYELVVAGAPRMLSAHLNLGICQTRLEMYDAASATLSRALGELKRGSHSWVLAHLNMGISQIGLARHAQAIRHLNLVVDSAPTNPLGWLWLSRAYQGTGQTTDAQQALERARSIDASLTSAFQASFANGNLPVEKGR